MYAYIQVQKLVNMHTFIHVSLYVCTYVHTMDHIKFQTTKQSPQPWKTNSFDTTVTKIGHEI